jgi:rubrerythrin
MPIQPMSNTVAALLELAITSEKGAEDLYRGLADKFSRFPVVADFWQGMQRDEVAHAKGIEKVRASLTPEQLLMSADSLVLEQAKRSASFSAKEALKSITTVEEAFELSHDLENSEINLVFEFILSEYVSQDAQREFATSLLREHIARLSKFPDAFRFLDTASPPSS